MDVDLFSSVTASLDQCASMDAHSFISELIQLGKPHAVLNERASERAHKYCEIIKDHLKQRYETVLSSSAVVFFAYGSDCTPLLVKKRINVSGASGKVVRRRASEGVELLVERAFVFAKSPSGSIARLCLLRDPRPLRGKTAWHRFNALCSFVALPRTLHDGLLICHYSFDRAIHTVMMDKVHARHELFYRLLPDADKESGKADHLELLEWAVGTPCCHHDSHNALHWGLKGVVGNEREVVRKLWGVCASLRAGYSTLCDFLGSFLKAVLVHDESAWDDHAHYLFWIALGVENDTASALAELGLEWTGTHLWGGLFRGLMGWTWWNASLPQCWVSTGSSSSQNPVGQLLGQRAVPSLLPCLWV